MSAYFTVTQRLALLARPVWSHEYDLNRSWSPTSRLLDETRLPLWWTPTGVALAAS